MTLLIYFILNTEIMINYFQIFHVSRAERCFKFLCLAFAFFAKIELNPLVTEIVLPLGFTDVIFWRKRSDDWKI